MELVGRAVKKEFLGLGIINGTVKSFEPIYGFFDVVYEDGDSEELDLNELVQILEEKVDLSIGERIKMRNFKQRPKKKRQRTAITDVGSGNFSSSLLKDDKFVEPHFKNVETLVKKCDETRVNDRFDLNVDISMGEEDTCFDLNRTINDDCDGNSKENYSSGKTHRVQHSFDINLGLEEEENEETEVEGGRDDHGSLNKSNSLENVMGNAFLKKCNGLGDFRFKEDSSSTAVEETQLKVKNGLSELERGEFRLGRDEGVQTGDRDLGGYEMVIALTYEDKTCLRPPRKEAGSSKKRGRPRKSKSAAQTNEVIHSEDRDLGGYGGGFSSNGTSSYYHMKSDGIDLNSVANCEDKSCYEPPDKEAHSRKKRGRPSKKSKPTTLGVLSSMESRSSDMIFPLSLEGKACQDRVIAENPEDKSRSEPPLKEADSQKKRGRASKKLKSAAQTALSTMEVGSSDEVFLADHGEKTCLEPPLSELCTLKEACTPRRRGRPSGESNSISRTKLRRSTRRSLSTSVDHVSSMDESLGSNTASFSHETSVVLDSNSEGCKEQETLPPKPDLPPSSKNLSIDEISVIDLFSVYSCLRSFSTILFLSPFRLEAFLEALKDRCPNSLIDSIHYSILQTLKLHLEFLSGEGSQSAANCLRSLNWALLDLVTWPVYMVEYLLIQGSELKPGFELTHLKFLMDDYYTQPAAMKLEILRCLCDEVFEGESVKSEINRRTQATELDMGVDRIVNVDMKRKRRDQIDDGGGSCLTQDVVEETADGNSDECCLCKMDGSLICCDGCPAAYHMRCVGITKASLLESEWFCPECLINRLNNQVKSPNSLRGAELLGIDPHGRLYFSTCGYLLVLDSCDPESSYSYYSSSDLNDVFEVLKTSHVFYGSIINAISVNWGVPGARDCENSWVDRACENLNVNNQMSDMLSFGAVPLSEIAEVRCADKPYEVIVQNQDLDCQGLKSQESVVKHDSGLASHSTDMGTLLAKSESLTEISKVVEVSQSRQEAKSCINQSSEFVGKSEIPGETHSKVVEGSLQSTISCAEKKTEAALSSHASVASTLCRTFSQAHCESVDYMNCYSFGQTAASVGREIRKLVDSVKVDFIWTPEEIISAQMRLIFNNWTNFSWPNIQKLHQNAQLEDCGWCFSCRTPAENESSMESGTCLFNMINKTPAPDTSESRAVSLQAKESRRNHLLVVICHMLSIEERLSGLLSGPWRFAGFSETWRKHAVEAADVASVKHLLLTLESNLRRLALLPEWLKHVDSDVTMGSASHVMTGPVQVSSSKQVGGRKRAKITVAESNSALICAAKSSQFWWRGGRLSRQLFNYNVLPHSLASRGGRQAGGKKVLGMLYPDGSDFAKQSKDTAWRASVEMSTSVAHLAYLVRELDSYIRWDDLENIQYFTHLSKESKKTMKLFKKVTIRRKCAEGTNVKYLLDFGKRKVIPKTVTRNGVMLEVSASERKKYWLEESLIPLHILKTYEEKKLARTSGKMKLEQLNEFGRICKKSSRKSGLLHLLSRVQKPQHYKCGHCKKDVSTRDAVNCQDCEGFFHKRHVRKSEHSTVTECSYQCQQCRDKIHVKKPAKAGSKKRKVKPHKGKKASINAQRQCLPRKVKRVRIQSEKLVAANKQKQAKFKNQQSKKSKKLKKFKKSKGEICWTKGGRRTQVFYAYWHNGLRLSRNSSDARSVRFRESKLLLPSQKLRANFVLPKCDLCCEPSYRSAAIYVNCENCQEWFHGEAFGASLDNSSMVIGFSCHKCRKRNPPICPYLEDVGLLEEGE